MTEDGQLFVDSAELSRHAGEAAHQTADGGLNRRWGSLNGCCSLTKIAVSTDLYAVSRSEDDDGARLSSYAELFIVSFSERGRPAVDGVKAKESTQEADVADARTRRLGSGTLKA